MLMQQGFHVPSYHIFVGYCERGSHHLSGQDVR